ncbi:Mariner Mos1 transposase [Eumeta japonica]|uniref:Mariner Mos1 transposase n=1 Tax=Eumeta variegata TaxID=151549 RepID=A0A4C1ZNL2_EUMVA|nr:Mariner Mos1 transposase [Eumeta japonica]
MKFALVDFLRIKSMPFRKKQKPFLKRLITGDEKWITYDKNVRKRSRSKGKQALKTIAKLELTRNILMLCVWWDWKGITHYELFPPALLSVTSATLKGVQKLFPESREYVYKLETKVSTGAEVPVESFSYWSIEAKLYANIYNVSRIRYRLVDIKVDRFLPYILKRDGEERLQRSMLSYEPLAHVDDVEMEVYKIFGRRTDNTIHDGVTTMPRTDLPAAAMVLKDAWMSLRKMPLREYNMVVNLEYYVAYGRAHPRGSRGGQLPLLGTPGTGGQVGVSPILYRVVCCVEGRGSTF